MTATSGRKCSALYRKPGPLGCLVRTLLESSRWSSTECFLTWRVKVTPANRLLFQLAPSMPSTDGTGCGLLPTAVQSNGHYNQGGGSGRVGKKRYSLIGMAKKNLWPIPRSQEKEQHNSRDVGMALSKMVKIWPTPRVTKNGGYGRHRGNNKARLEDEVHNPMRYPAPTANRRDGLQSHGRNVVSGSLNPAFVEWLMGFPLGFTALKDSAMQSFRKSRMKSSKRLRK